MWPTWTATGWCRSRSWWKPSTPSTHPQPRCCCPLEGASCAPITFHAPITVGTLTLRLLPQSDIRDIKRQQTMSNLANSAAFQHLDAKASLPASPVPRDDCSESVITLCQVDQMGERLVAIENLLRGMALSQPPNPRRNSLPTIPDGPAQVTSHPRSRQHSCPMRECLGPVPSAPSSRGVLALFCHLAVAICRQL